jgi:hypothetical protein
MSAICARPIVVTITALACLYLSPGAQADTQEPVLRGNHWVAIAASPGDTAGKLAVAGLRQIFTRNMRGSSIYSAGL